MRRRDVGTAAAAASAIVVIACLVAMRDSWHLQSAFARSAAGTLVAAGLPVAITVGMRAYLHHKLSRQLLQLSWPTTVGGTVVHEMSGIEGAFVAGIFRPQIFWSSRLASRLTSAELRGVLLHEQYHQLDRAPAKQVVLDAVAPLLRRSRAGRAWFVRRLGAFEVAADSYALRHGASRAALARALLKLEPLGAASLGIGFSTAAELRIRALLGPASEPAQRPAARRWVVELTLGLASICLLLLPLQ